MALYIFVIATHKNPINPIINSKPVSAHKHMTLETEVRYDRYFGLGPVVELCAVRLEHT
jgi:hypothetical protein